MTDAHEAAAIHTWLEELAANGDADAIDYLANPKPSAWPALYRRWRDWRGLWSPA